MNNKLTIPGKLPGLNDLEDLARTHWSKAAKRRKELVSGLALIIKNQRPPKYTKIYLNIDYYEQTLTGRYARDPDNIAGGAKKLLIDALVVAGVIPNDKHDQIGGWVERFYEDAKNPRIEIRLVGFGFKTGSSGNVEEFFNGT